MLAISSLRDMELFPLIVEGLRSKGMGHVLIAGGIMPEEDVSELKKLGIEPCSDRGHDP